jgi:T-complex protein 11
MLFVELRNILCSLLPSPDRGVVCEVIDSNFLCQQLFRGVLDVKNLYQFLETKMKEHCAPMRDAMIEQMRKQFEYAQATDSTRAFVLGLRMVFELLERMKLVIHNT